MQGSGEKKTYKILYTKHLTKQKQISQIPYFKVN